MAVQKSKSKVRVTLVVDMNRDSYDEWLKENKWEDERLENLLEYGDIQSFLADVPPSESTIVDLTKD